MIHEIITEFFEIKETHYNFRSAAFHFKRGNIKPVHYRIHSVRHLSKIEVKKHFRDF